ncbi:hypothetical protein ACWC3X_15030 [Streptomyces populi]
MPYDGVGARGPGREAVRAELRRPERGHHEEQRLRNALQDQDDPGAHQYRGRVARDGQQRDRQDDEAREDVRPGADQCGEGAAAPGDVLLSPPQLADFVQEDRSGRLDVGVPRTDERGEDPDPGGAPTVGVDAGGESAPGAQTHATPAKLEQGVVQGEGLAAGRPVALGLELVRLDRALALVRVAAEELAHGLPARWSWWRSIVRALRFRLRA